MSIYYFTPYAINKNLGDAYNKYMDLLPKETDWACFLDGDTMFLSPNWGEIIQNNIKNHPNTGMFTCYTNRVNNPQQLYRGKFSEVRDIVTHRNISKVCNEIGKTKVKPLTRMISGMMMVIQKKTWRNFPFKDGLLGVDNDISDRLLKAERKILLMEGIYLLHYYRLNEGRTYKQHLISKNEGCYE